MFIIVIIGVSNLKKVVKILIMSLMVCFFVTFTLFISNLFMGVAVGIRYYFMLFQFGTLALFGTLFLCNMNRIFAKKRRAPQARVAKKTTSTKKQKQNISRRKVS